MGYEMKPVEHQMEVQGVKMNYAEIGSDSLPVAFFVMVRQVLGEDLLIL